MIRNGLNEMMVKVPPRSMLTLGDSGSTPFITRGCVTPYMTSALQYDNDPPTASLTSTSNLRAKTSSF